LKTQHDFVAAFYDYPFLNLKTIKIFAAEEAFTFIYQELVAQFLVLIGPCRACAYFAPG